MNQDFQTNYGGAYEGGFRKRRPVTDYGSSMLQWMRNRQPRFKGGVVMEMERPSSSYVVDMLPPAAKVQMAADALPTRHLHSSLNKIKLPINTVLWTPEGRRILTGSSGGEFTLWNGMAFNFETIMQAHDSAIRATKWSHSEDWLLSADQDGWIKYWQPNFNNVKEIKAHKLTIRDLAFSPNDNKFVTGSDDATLKIFDFSGGIEESNLTGHNWDVKSVDWHPTKGLLVSGSKDHQVKLWDPRTGRCLTTLHGHKNTISKTLFEPSRGQLLATCARDQTARIFDLRMMRDICLLRGHEKDITTLIWHPTHVSLLTTGGADGSIFHYLLDEPNAPVGTATSIPPYDSPEPANAPPQIIYPAHKIQHAHSLAVWSLDWHPLGHILASGSNDKVTRFWARARPGETDCLKDKFHLGEAAAEAQGTWDRRGERRLMREDEEQEIEDEAEGLVDQKMPSKQPVLPGIPGLAIPGAAATKENISGGNKKTLSSMDLPPHPPSLPKGIAGMGADQFAKLIAGGNLPLPPPPPPLPPHPPQQQPTSIPGSVQGLPPLPPPPISFDFSKMPAGMFPPGFQLPSGFPPPPMGGNHNQNHHNHNNINNGGGGGLPGLPVENSGGTGGRRRAPLPSQQESLMEEQRRGKYRSVR